MGISNDTGCGHLLATANIPVLTLFGPTSAEKFKPYTNTESYCLKSTNYGSRRIEKIPCSEVKNIISKVLKR